MDSSIWNMKKETTLEMFHRELEEHNISVCPKCQKPINQGDVSWNEGSTEAGTGCTWSQIVCQRCEHELAHWWSWYSECPTFEEWVEDVLPDLKMS